MHASRIVGAQPIRSALSAICRRRTHRAWIFYRFVSGRSDRGCGGGSRAESCAWRAGWSCSLLTRRARRWFMQSVHRGGPTTIQMRSPQYTQTSRRIRTRPVVTSSDCNGAHNFLHPRITLPTPHPRFVPAGPLLPERHESSHHLLWNTWSTIGCNTHGVRMRWPWSWCFPCNDRQYRAGFGGGCEDEI